MIAKRAELSGELSEAQKRIARLRADLDSPDATIQLFDPSIKPVTIRSRVRRTEHPNASVPYRQTDPSYPVGAAEGREAADRADISDLTAAEWHLDMSTIQATNVVVNVQATLARSA